MTAPVRAGQRFTGGVAIEITCRSYGQPYIPTAEDFRCGPEVYRICPACRPVAERDPEVAE
jgi:hypothetical protein